MNAYCEKNYRMRNPFFTRSDILLTAIYTTSNKLDQWKKKKTKLRKQV